MKSVNEAIAIRAEVMRRFEDLCRFEDDTIFSISVVGGGPTENEISTLDKNGTYAVYCRSGNRSGQAVAIMHDAGFHNVYNLNGGIIDWTNSGMMLVNN
jgi:NADH dehydrogenase